MGKEMILWGAAATWVSFCCYYISHTKIKLSIFELLMMMPDWCEMTDLVGTGYIVLSPQATIRFCFGTVLLLFVCWYITADADVEAMTSEATSINEYVKTKIEQEEITVEVLLENAKSLLDKVDLEYKHCAATIASNNETHGRKVGGEAEWATGETSSEDEDATREITGARLRKSPKESEEEQIFRFLQQPDDDHLQYKPNDFIKLTSELNVQEKTIEQL